MNSGTKKKLAWRKKKKSDLLAKQKFPFACPFSGHPISDKSEVELCHKRCVGMRGDGDTDDNVFLGCRNGNRAQGSKHLDDYMDLPDEVRRKHCGY